ncbi:hypothetical protein C8J56DRAFT_958439 [Mycena floridula]|nr:hypothetical protein C8J56DRAFT_958439 [Mycena floridula]
MPATQTDDESPATTNPHLLYMILGILAGVGMIATFLLSRILKERRRFRTRRSRADLQMLIEPPICHDVWLNCASATNQWQEIKPLSITQQLSERPCSQRSLRQNPRSQKFSSRLSDECSVGLDETRGYRAPERNDVIQVAVFIAMPCQSRHPSNEIALGIAQVPLG